MMTELSMQIDGMTCGHCVQAVRNALSAVPGVAVDSVAIGSATVHFDEQAVSRDRVTHAVEAEGYPVTVAT